MKSWIFFSSHVTGQPSNGDYDVKNLLDKIKTQVKFTKDEIKYGEKPNYMKWVLKKTKKLFVLLLETVFI